MHRRNRHLNPASAGAQCVLDARFISGQADNTTLQTWPSRSIASITATQSTSGSRPTYRNPSINGQPALVFDGTDDVYNLSAGALPLSANTDSIWALTVGVCSAIGDVLQYGLFTSRNTNATTNRFSIRLADTSVQRGTMSVRRLDGDTNVVTTSAGSTAANHVFTGYNDYAGAGVAGAQVNGGALQTIAFSSGAGAGPTGDSLAMAVGGLSTSSSRLNGKLAQVLIMSPMPSTSLAKRLRQCAAVSFKISSQ